MEAGTGDTALLCVCVRACRATGHWVTVSARFAGGRRREALPYPSMSCAAVNATELS
jgi:hypothetical protein